MPLTAFPQVISTFAGAETVYAPLGENPASAYLATAGSVCADPAGNVYISGDPAASVAFPAVLRISTATARIQLHAGNYIAGDSGDGGPAVQSSLRRPTSIACDSAGNVYIADQGAHRVRRVSPDGKIVTVAGTGIAGHSGDGGPAVQAALTEPAALALDRAGNLFIAEGGFNFAWIRRVDANGRITTYAGRGASGFAGDGGPAAMAAFWSPTGLAVDAAGNLLVADQNNNRIRRISSTGVVSTFAGNGSQTRPQDGVLATSTSTALPTAVAVDAQGAVYVSAGVPARFVRRVTSDGLITRFAGFDGAEAPEGSGDGGPAAQAGLTEAAGLAFDLAGNLLIADTGEGRIRVVARTGVIRTLAGVGRSVPAGSQLPGAVRLGRPDGVAAEASGSVLVADSFHRRIYRIRADGSLSVYAGNGSARTSTGNSALNVSMQPSGVAADGASNVFYEDFGRINQIAADSGIGRLGAGNAPAVDGAGNLYFYRVFVNSTSGQPFWQIFRRPPNGTAGAVAGGGQDSMGEGIPASSALLLGVRGIAVDSRGAIYFSETMPHHRVRRISEGLVSTVAGAGPAGFEGDGGPAMRAKLSNPSGLALDRQGNLYIADSSNGRVRRVDAAGVISTFAGGGRSGDGTAANQAALASPAALSVDAAGNLYIADPGDGRIRKVTVTSPTFQLSANRIRFEYSQDGSAPPPQTVQLTSSISGVQFSASTPSAPWLLATPNVGAMPQALQVGVVPTGLAPGNYTASLTVSAPLARPASAVISVEVTVRPPLAPALSVETRALTFEGLERGESLSQQLSVRNNGSGTLGFVAAASTERGGDWLTVSTSASLVSANAPQSLTVTANPAGLTAGTYTGNIVVLSQDGSQRAALPVTLTIKKAQTVLLVSQNGLTFRAVAGGGTSAPQTIGILNLGAGAMSWTAQASTRTGGNWLTLGQTSGRTERPFLDVSGLEVVVNSANVAPGDHYGEILVSAAGADNSPQAITVVLNVLPPGSNPGPEIRPSGLIFTGVQGSQPGSQNATIANLGAMNLTFATSRAYLDAVNWFQHVPTAAAVSGGQLAQIVVKPDFSLLSPGVQFGAVNLIFSDFSIRNVAVLSVVAPPNVPSLKEVPAAAGCVDQLVLLPTTLSAGFQVAIGRPVPIEVSVTEKCAGRPVTTGTLNVGFSNGDSSLKLVHIRDGRWTGTWSPRAGAGPVTLSVTAITTRGASNLVQQIDVAGTLQIGADSPSVARAGVVNGASFEVGKAVAPGSLVSVFGTRLSDARATVETSPLPEQLAGTQVLVQNRPLKLLFVSDTQVNAQLPFDLAADTQLQVVVRRGDTISTPELVSVASGQPAVFTVDRSGKGQGIVVDGLTNLIADGANPVGAGDTVVIYCSGLGAVSPGVEAGQPAPASPLSRVNGAVSARIGGLPASVAFAGLTPNFTGLYQINAVVPQGIGPGIAVPLVIAVDGVESPAVTIAVK